MLVNSASPRTLPVRQTLNVSPVRATAADTRVAQPQTPAGAFPSFDSPTTYKAYVVNLVARAKMAQTDLASAQAKGDQGAIRSAVEQLGLVQLQLIVARKEGMRKAPLWSGFDAAAFWQGQRQALPNKLLLSASEAIAQGPSLSDPANYKNYATKLVTEAQTAQRMLDQAKAALAKGTGSQADVAAASQYREATLGELVLLKQDGDTKSLAWRMLKGFNEKDFWQTQAAQLPAGFSLARQTLEDNITIKGSPLGAASVVKAWPGQQGELSETARTNGADNVIFTVGNETYMASAANLDVADLRPGTALTFRGQTGRVIEAVSCPNTTMKMIKSAFGRVADVLPNPIIIGLMGVGGLVSAVMALPAGMHLSLASAAIVMSVPVVLFGALAVMGAMMCFKAMHAILQVNLFAAEANGDPQYVAPKLK